MNILGCLSTPIPIILTFWGLFLHMLGCLRNLQIMGLKLKIDFGIHHIQIQHHQIILKTLDTDFYPKMPGEVSFSDF